MNSTFDLIVIGGGSGGLAAAGNAVRAGKRVLLVNDGAPGGDCTFWGCIPSKALISQAAKGATFSDAMAHIRHAVGTVAAAESFDVLRNEGYHTANGRAVFVSPTTIDVEGARYEGDNFVIATGSRAVVPPIPGIEDVDYLTNHGIFDLTHKPKSLAVLGGGPIGAEIAQAMGRLGVEVTLYEMTDRLLIKEEPEVSNVIEAVMRADGVDVRIGTTVTGLKKASGGGILVASTAGDETFEQLLVATGRRPNSEGLGLDIAGVKVSDRGYIVADDKLGTNVDHIFAAGDVTGKLPFTHAADEMGRLAAAFALRLPHRWKFKEHWIPWVTFTSPEVARIGLTEAEAASKGGRVAFLPMSEFDRAITDGATDGFVKLIAGPKPLTRRIFGGEIIGATIVAPRAGEMINEISLAMRTRMFTGRLGQTAHAYPTWSVAIQQASAQFFFEQNGREARPARP